MKLHVLVSRTLIVAELSNNFSLFKIDFEYFFQFSQQTEILPCHDLQDQAACILTGI